MNAKHYPYAGLGNLLKRWRTARFRTPAEFFAACKVSVAEATYLEYEAGTLLPPPPMLDELAQALGQDFREALLVWAQVQMTAPEHKAFFSRHNFERNPRNAQAPGASTTAPITSNQIPTSEFENTWVFGDFEQVHLAKYPWIFQFLVGLATVHPLEASFSSFGFESGEEQELFIERYLKTWVVQKRIEVTKTGFRLVQRYLHMPKTPQWQPTRDAFLGNVLEALIPKMTPELIAARKSHRTQIHKNLTEAQRDSWIARLGELEMEFSLTPNAPAGDATPTQTYSLMVLMAPRELGLPAHITKGRKKFSSAA